MAETLGSLCDKLTVVKLKQWHSDDRARLASLGKQERQLREEIDELVSAATAGGIPVERLSFAANKVYKQEGQGPAKAVGTIGELFARLAHVNCDLWHEQEKVYEFEKVPGEEKNAVVKALAVLNLERTGCIDAIDTKFRSIVEELLSGN